jgi:hypothetical protein
MVWSWFESAQIDGVDGGMVFVSFVMVGLPIMALGGTGPILLALPPVPRYYLRTGNNSDSVGS